MLFIQSTVTYLASNKMRTTDLENVLFIKTHSDLNDSGIWGKSFVL